MACSDVSLCGSIFFTFATGAFFAGARLEEACAGSDVSDSASGLFLRQSDEGAAFSFGFFGIGFDAALEAGLTGDFVSDTFFSGISDSEELEFLRLMAVSSSSGKVLS